MNNKQVLTLAGLIIVGCAALVWALERYEMGRLHAEVGSYLNKYDEFRHWLETHE